MPIPGYSEIISIGEIVMKEKLIIIGTSTNGLHVYKMIQYYDLFDVIGFAVDKEYKTNEEFCGLPVYDLENLDKYIDKSKIFVFIALLWNRLNSDRRLIYLRLKEQGYKFANVVSPNAIIRGELKGDNCWINDYVIIQNNATVHNNVAVMSYSLIGSNVEIEDHCFLGAKSTVGGGSVIGEQSFVGINCTVFDGTIVGKKCILGACTSVKRNVPDYSLYKTSSDIVIKQYDKDSIENKLLFKKNVR